MIDDIDRQLEDAEHALHRLEDGTYGICEGCGRPIPPERLEAQPAARFCVEDQQRFERGSRAPS
ncbi:MAG: TraR/DksA C4-type zinc finger protein [Actinomycetota bacterium]